MRSIIKKLLTLTLAFLLVFSCMGCQKTNTEEKPLDQWDYINEFVSYSLYTVDENHKDYNWGQGWGEIVGSQSEYSIKRVAPEIQGCENFYYIAVTPIKEKSVEIEITSIEFDIYVEEARNFNFDVIFGSDKIREMEVDCYPNQANKIRVLFYREICWEKPSVKSIFFKLQEPNWIANNKYIFKNMVIGLRKTR